MSWHNPIKRHYTIIALFVVVGFTGALYLVNFAPSYASSVLLSWAIVCWIIMFVSGRCQHCGKPIQQVKFGLPESRSNEICYNCGKKYSEPAS